MAFTLNRRLSQLVDSSGQLNTGKIPNDYISSDHIADNIITSAMLHSGFTVSASNLGTTLTPTFGNITTTGYIAGPATFTIDPAAVGDNTGTVVIAGNLQVDGTTTTINSTTMTVDDLNLTLASGAANAAAANGAGITVDGASATITYDGTNDEWDFNKGIHIAGTSSLSSEFKIGNLTWNQNTGSTSGLLHQYRGSDGYSELQINNTATSGAVSLNIRNDSNSVARIANNGDAYFKGDVGIGESNPSDKLEIKADSGHLRLKSATTTTKGLALLFDNSNNRSEIRSDQAGVNQLDLQYYALNHNFGRSASNLTLHISDDNKVGIGTVSPTGKLTIANPTAYAPNTITTANTYIQLGSTDYGSGGSSSNDGKFMIGFGYTDGTTNTHSPGYIGFEETSTSGDTKGNLTFYTRDVITDTAPTERMRIDSSGLVHIGNNSNTDHKGLHIYKSTNDVYQPNTFNEESLLRLNAPNATGNYAGITYTHAGETEFFTGLVRVGGTSDIADYILQGYNGNTNAYQQYMRITSNGNVGIGTVTVPTGLEVYSKDCKFWHGNINYYTKFEDQNEINTYTSAGANSTMYLQHPGGDLELCAGILYVDRSASGVGIGLSNPETELHVKGTNGSAGDLYTQVGPGNTPSITIQNAGTTNNNNAVLYFRDDTDMRASVGARFVNHSTNESELRFSTTDGSGNTRERVTFKGDGDIGFGTTAPQSYGGRNFEFYDASTTQTGIRISASASQFEVGTDSTGGYLQPITPGDGITLFSANTAAADTIAMKVHSTGQVTKPKNPAFRAYLSTEQTSNGTITTGFTDNNTTASRAYDNNGDFNTTTGRFTAPVSGVYIFSIMWDSNASQGGFNLLVNGSNYNVMWEPTGLTNDGWESRYYGTHMKLSTNDYVQLTVVHASGSYPVHQGSGTWGHFAGCLVG